MYRWTSSLDIGLGMAYGNRMTKMERKLIGMMVSTVPLEWILIGRRSTFIY